MWKKILVIIAIVFLLTGVAQAGDWPMFHHDARHTGYTDESIPEDLELLWSYETGGWVESSPTVLNGVLYVGSNDGNLYALDIATGNLKWKYTIGGKISSSPAIHDGITYIQSNLQDKNIYAIDSDTGALKWKFKTKMAVDDVASSPAVVDGTVYVGSNDHSDSLRGSVYALDAYTGDLKWRFTTDIGTFVSSPAVSGGIVYIGSTPGTLYALDKYTGAILWEFNAEGEGNIRSSPVVSNGMVYISCQYCFVPGIKNKIYAVSASNGALKWEFEMESEGTEYSSPAIYNNVVYVGSDDGHIYALSANTGDLKWKYKTGYYVYSSPAVSSDGTVFIGSYDGDIYALDANTGNLKWNYRTGGWIFSSPAIADKKVFVGSKDGKIYCFGAKSILPATVSSTVPTVPPVTSTPTPTPTPAPFASIPPFYIIGAAAVIAIILIAGIGISRKGKSGISESTKPQPPTEPPKPKTEPAKPESGINITSAFGYKGASILYKIKVKNSTPEPISDIRVSLFVPDVFLLREKEKSIAMLEPNESNTVTFEIRPTGECGDCNVSGRVNYYDYNTKKRQEVDIETRSLSIVCPLLKAKKIDRTEWKDTVSRLIQAEESTKEIQIPAETLFNMTSRVIEDKNMFMLEPEVTSSPQLFNGVARFYAEGVKELKYAAQIEVVGGAKKSKLILKAWAEKEEALTGFYHGMLDEIEKRVQVKGYIDDSIVQQFYHIGDRIGAVVKDSVVQRSTLGAGAGKK